MKERLEQFFECKVKVSECKSELPLPIFMTMRDINQIDLCGVRFAVVNIKNEAELTVAAMKKQQKQYEEALRCPVVYDVAVNSIAMRNALVRNGISFIDLPGNVFLPFMGIVLQDRYIKKHIRADKMMPATQMVFLELLYMADNESALKSEIAGRLNLTKTSITRATAQLKEMGLISQKRTGTEIAISRNYSGREYYEKAKEYLINPVQKTVTVMKNESTRDMWYAGESALSRKTLLNPPRIEERAVYKGNELVDQFDYADERVADKDSITKIQLWKYNPVYFARNGMVDPVSLLCSFKGNGDERIEMCMEELLEEL